MKSLIASVFYVVLLPVPALCGPEDTTITIHTDCSRYKPGVLTADTECRIRKNKLLDAEGSKLDAELAEAEKRHACVNELRLALKAGKTSHEEIRKYGKDRACELARKF